MTKVTEHVKQDHKEIELTPENIASIKSLIKEILFYVYFHPKHNSSNS